MDNSKKAARLSQKAVHFTRTKSAPSIPKVQSRLSQSLPPSENVSFRSKSSFYYPTQSSEGLPDLIEPSDVPSLHDQIVTDSSDTSEKFGFFDVLKGSGVTPRRTKFLDTEESTRSHLEAESYFAEVFTSPPESAAGSLNGSLDEDIKQPLYPIIQPIAESPSQSPSKRGAFSRKPRVQESQTISSIHELISQSLKVLSSEQLTEVVNLISGFQISETSSSLGERSESSSSRSLSLCDPLSTSYIKLSESDAFLLSQKRKSRPTSRKFLRSDPPSPNDGSPPGSSTFSTPSTPSTPNAQRSRSRSEIKSADRDPSPVKTLDRLANVGKRSSKSKRMSRSLERHLINNETPRLPAMETASIQAISCSFFTETKTTIEGFLEQLLRGQVDGTLSRYQLSAIILVWPQYAPTSQLLKYLMDSFTTIETPEHRTQIVQFLCNWFETQIHDFKDELFKTLHKWIKSIAKSETALASTISQNFLKSQKLLGIELSEYTGETKVVLAPHLQAMKASDDLSGLSFSDFDVTELARQMTLFAQRLYIAVPTTEYLNGNFLIRSKSPNLTKISDWFNILVIWIGTEICLLPSAKKRGNMIHKLVTFAVEMKRMQNWLGVMAIVAGLHQHSIKKLKSSWKAVPTSSQTTLGTLKELLSPIGNFRQLRVFHDQPASTGILSPVLVIRDLMAINEGNTDYITETEINLPKVELLGGYLYRLAQLRRVVFKFQRVPIIQKFFENLLQSIPPDEFELRQDQIDAKVSFLVKSALD